MNVMSFDFLTDMTLEEKKALSDQLAFELRGGKAPISDAAYELWDALSETVGQKAVKAHLLRFLEDFGKAKYANAVEVCEHLLTAAVPKGTRKPIVMAVRRVVLACLADHLRAQNIPATPRVILNNIGMLRYAVDQQYPGYIDAQLLHRVAQAVAA